jgi:hypothetical protein
MRGTISMFFYDSAKPATCVSEGAPCRGKLYARCKDDSPNTLHAYFSRSYRERWKTREILVHVPEFKNLVNAVNAIVSKLQKFMANEQLPPSQDF